jgi:hypothetical protein
MALPAALGDGSLLPAQMRDREMDQAIPLRVASALSSRRKTRSFPTIAMVPKSGG